MVLAQKRHADHWNTIEDPEISTHRYSHLIFDNVTKNICWGKNSLFNKLCQENWIFTCRIQKLDTYISPCTKLNSKWIKVVNEGIEH
jgi:hypothetical protein